MSLKIKDEEIKHFKSGVGLRFSVMFFADAAEEVGTEIKGCLAFRTEEGSLEVKPPVTMLRMFGKVRPYKIVEFTPQALAAIKSYVESEFGPRLKSDPDWNLERKANYRRENKILEDL